MILRRIYHSPLILKTNKYVILRRVYSPLLSKSMDIEFFIQFLFQNTVYSLSIARLYIGNYTNYF